MDREASTQFLNSIKIVDVGRLLGLSLPDHGNARCPFPDHVDLNPSFSISRNRNYWTCYGCGRKGGAIDLVKEVLGKSFIDAKHWLGGHYGAYPIRSSVDLPRSRVSPKALVKAPTLPDSEVLSALIDVSPIHANGKNYLRRRAISIETIQLAKVGQMNDSINRMKILIEKFGFDRVYMSGLLTKASIKSEYKSIFPDNYLLFPFSDNGKIIYVQARAIENLEKAARWRNLNFLPRVLYELRDESKSDSADFAICEGIVDALSAVELGYRALALMGVSADIPPSRLIELRHSHVDVLLDWDAPGEKRATEVMATLSRQGISAIRKRRPFPNVKDLNEYLIQKSETR